MRVCHACTDKENILYYIAARGALTVTLKEKGRGVQVVAVVMVTTVAVMTLHSSNEKAC